MKTSTLLLFVFLSINLFAQKAPIKWGKVDKKDLEMQVYEADPEAEAVILADFADLNFDFSTGEFLYLLERHVRIKILKKSAFDRGDIEILYYSNNKSEKISGLKAQVILPNGDKQSIRKKDFFDEAINEYWSQRKFSFPGLEEGCIIEYKYTKKSDQIYYLEDWYFQHDIPTRWSEYRTNIPEWFDYINFNQGLRPTTEKSDINKKLAVPRQRITTNANSLSSRGSSMSSGSVDARIIKTRYYLENIPALKPENYITTMQDYYSKLSLQLKYVKFPNSPFQDVTTTWSKEETELLESKRFGGQLYQRRYIRKLMAELKPLLLKAETDLEKVATIYTYLSNNIKWNKQYGTRSNSLDKAFETKTANSAELNMMLIAMCHQIGLEAHPVLISTRSHGKMMKYYPKTDQFNHVIAHVEIGDQQALFDVGSPNRDPSLLRKSSLNYSGWLVEKDKSRWISIPVPSDTEMCLAKLSVDETGKISGEITQSFKGYSAMTARTNYHRNKEEDHQHIREAWQTSFPDVEVKNIEFENEESITKPLTCKLNIDIPEAAQVNDDFIYISPMMGQGRAENPLKQEERTFPVDIPIKFKEQYVLNLTIPEGYVVDELPETINMKTEGDGARFQFLVSQTGNKIQVISKVVITQIQYQPNEYATIKNFFDLIVEKHGEQIVLKKQS